MYLLEPKTRMARIFPEDGIRLARANLDIAW
jgi:hypothetical protein